jgi:hypothetical protein
MRFLRCHSTFHNAPLNLPCRRLIHVLVSTGLAAAGADCSKLVAHGLRRLRGPGPPMCLREVFLWRSLAGSAAFFRAVAEAFGQALARVSERFVVLELPLFVVKHVVFAGVAFGRPAKTRFRANFAEQLVHAPCRILQRLVVLAVGLLPDAALVLLDHFADSEVELLGLFDQQL